MSLSEKVWTTADIVNKSQSFKLKGDEKWVRVSDAQQEIDDCKASWQNLKDTIPKFDAKILYLETQLKCCNMPQSCIRTDVVTGKSLIKYTKSSMKKFLTQQYAGG